MASIYVRGRNIVTGSGSKGCICVQLMKKCYVSVLTSVLKLIQGLFSHIMSYLELFK